MSAADVADVIAIEGPPRLSSSDLQIELARPWSRCWVARGHDGPVVAYLLAWLVVDELHILNIATHPEHRRQGHARALFDEGLRMAREHRLVHVLLEVRRSNRPAIALYRQLGFFAMGVRLRYYPDDEDAVDMRLVLDPLTGLVVRHDDEVRLGD